MNGQLIATIRMILYSRPDIMYTFTGGPSGPRFAFSPTISFGKSAHFAPDKVLVTYQETGRGIVSEELSVEDGVDRWRVACGLPM